MTAITCSERYAKSVCSWTSGAPFGTGVSMPKVPLPPTWPVSVCTPT